MKHRPEIDGLRAVAVLPVILFHTGLEVFSGGFIGVDIFFVISGFLITSILLADMEQGVYSLLTFYERRARRILPALMAMILCIIPLAWIILLPTDLLDFGQSIVASMTFSSNILFWREINYFAINAELKPLLHTWSLSVEEQFYIVFPPLLALIFNRLRIHLLPILLCLAFGSLVLAQIGTSMSPSAAFFLLPARGWELLIGCLSAVIIWRKIVPLNHYSLNEGLSIFGLSLIFGAIVLVDESSAFPGVNALAPTLGTTLVLLFARPGTLVARMLSVPFLAGIGLISYSAYLWHQPLISLFNYRYPMVQYGPVFMGLLALPLGWISWKFVESPFRKKQVLATRSACLIASLIGLIVIALIGGVLTLQQGWKTRYPLNEQLILESFRDHSSYVQTRFGNLLGTPFPTEHDRQNIIIIGDSYGQDLVNALYESGLSEDYNFSTHHISSACGNLMLKDLAQYQQQEDRAKCRTRLGYDHPGLINKMQTADEIWLASAWNEWSAPLLEQSLATMANLTNKPIVIFGRKHFGLRDLRDYHVDGINALVGEKKVPENLAEIQRWMANHIPSLTRYIDVQSLMCQSHDRCSNHDEQGRPLTFDGTHLTPAGARYMGQKLKLVLKK